MQVIEGKIDSIAFGGDGVMRTADGRVVFVPFTNVGERVRVELTRVKKTFARGRVLEILDASPDRATAPCEYYGRCGGCQLQHMNYEAQLGAKQRFVQDALTRIGQLREVDVKPVIGTDQTWNYRRHIKLRVRGTQVGFAGQQANEFVPVEKCLIFAGTLPSIPNTLDASLRWHDKNREFDVGGLHFQYNEHAFVQAHPTQSARLYGDLIQPAKKVLDLYCGIGVTSLLFAKQGAQVVGVEGNAEAIRLAKLNAQHNQIQSVMWHTANVDDVAQALCDEHRPDLILVNPPRTGLNKPVIDALIKSGANQIFYVSCMPSTLARDLALLTASAYRIANCQPYDMFPQTTHVETFVRLIATNQS